MRCFHVKRNLSEVKEMGICRKYICNVGVDLATSYISCIPRYDVKWTPPVQLLRTSVSLEVIKHPQKK